MIARTSNQMLYVQRAKNNLVEHVQGIHVSEKTITLMTTERSAYDL